MLLKVTVFCAVSFGLGCSIQAEAQVNSPILHQALQFNLDVISQNPSQNWVVGNFKPDRKNSTLEIKSQYINGDTGEIVQRPGGQDVVSYSGRFTVIQKLFAVSKDSYGIDYVWKIPYKPSIRPKNDKDQEEVAWRSGGLALLRWYPEKTGRDMFEDIHTLPFEWADFVKPALEVVSADDFKNAPNAESLISFLKSNNPLVGLTAARVLNQSHLLTGESVISAFGTSFESPSPVATEALAFWTTQKLPAFYSEKNATSLNADAEQTVSKILQHATAKDLIALLKGMDASRFFVAYTYPDFKPLPGFGPTLLRQVEVKVRALPLLTDESKEALSFLSNFFLERPK